MKQAVGHKMILGESMDNASSAQQEMILVVDDDESIRGLLQAGIQMAG